MRACQISRQKAKYLRALSQAVLNKDLDFEELPKLNSEEVRKNLQALKELVIGQQISI
jgi:DNA-3-methyladenine glycosylase II